MIKWFSERRAFISTAPESQQFRDKPMKNRKKLHKSLIYHELNNT